MKALTNALCAVIFGGIAIAQQQGSGGPAIRATITSSARSVRPDGVTKATGSTKLFFRDGLGRTRTQDGNRVIIYDPSTHVTLTLDLAKRTANVTQGRASSPGSDAPNTVIQQEPLIQTSRMSQVARPRVQQKPILRLGEKQMEGVTAVGYRAELLMPPGSTGNILPMRHVSEIWRSAALQLTLKRTTTDSEIRIGGDRLAREVTETYTDITTPATLDPSLFAVP